MVIEVWTLWRVEVEKISFISIEYSTRIPPTGYYLCGSLFIHSTDLMPLDPAACVADQLPP